LAEVIARPKYDAILVRSNTSPERSLAEVRELTEVIAPPPLAEPVCRDPDDDAVLALGVAANVDFIVSGDGDLLTLKIFQGISILTPAEALRLVESE
jgi:putative PIN family toxin of toxin-antitoxin system